MVTSIKKRDGRVVPFDPIKIEQAIEKSFMASGSQKSAETAHELSTAHARYEGTGQAPPHPVDGLACEVVPGVLGDLSH